MKPILKIAGVFAIMGILLTTIITSCQKNATSEIRLTESDSKAKLENLVDKFFETATEESISEVAEMYNNLTAKEVNEFLVIKNERELRDLSSFEKSENNKYTTGQFELLKQQATLIGEYRLELNRTGLERYGLAVNKLDNSQFQQLSNEILKANKFRILGTDINPVSANKSDALLAPCATSTWPYSCPRITFTGGPGYYGEYRIDNDPNATFCDYEYRFDGIWNRVRGERVVDNNVIGSGLGRRSISYSDGFDTGLIVGYNTKVFWLGTNNLYCRVKFV